MCFSSYGAEIRPELITLLCAAVAGEAANALLQEAAHDSGADGEMPPPGSLEELFRGGTTAALRCGDLVTLLGHQQQPLGGGRAACYMLLRCQPATMVAPDQARHPIPPFP